ncbi:hypothetical protein POF50_031630 [Streptomyces sp. SL13]|jgi:hypothetical protein|uniref:Uncharacterized protein n=1 Tax=Streptantibioticus silvisoli TaxID=2705255 RepID=A0AA90H9T0_9ACTN|nr:hypothetical protein [Streptantibioticus silvisoli]MDI5961992.1 hypothetical protein [Streptantibioticus silvisoli]MDI5973840.1 hypothetical protein [Streptantibioticus silvisoli]
MATVTFVDETTSGSRDEAWALAVAEERLSLRELIRRRIFQEVAEFNAAAHTGTRMFRGLVTPTRTETALNGARAREPRRIDAEEQFARAVTAFGRNGFVVLVGDRQVEDLDARIELALGAEVTFLKLVPLVGG